MPNAITLYIRPEGEATSYATFNGNTYFCQKVKPGLFNMNLTMGDVTILKVPFKKVDAYSNIGHFGERLPVICEATPATCRALMEYVTSRGGFRLHKRCKYGECGRLWRNTYKKAHLQVEYYVFKNGIIYLQVTNKNVGSVLQFFHIPVI